MKVPASLVTLVLLIVLSGCDTQGDSAFKDDSAAVNEVRRIEAVMARAPRLSQGDLDSLKRLHGKYPQADEVRHSLQTALQAVQDWDALAKLIAEKPEAELEQPDKLNLAKVYIKLGRYDDAGRILGPLADAAPNDLESNTLAGHAWYYEGKYDDAARVFDRVWSAVVAGKQIDYITMRGMICFYKGDQPRATELLKKALEIRSDYIPANNGLSRVYAAQGNTQRAEFYRKQAESAHAAQTALETKQMRLTSRARDLEQAFNSGRYDEAVLIASEMLATADDSLKPTLYEYLGHSYQATGKQSEAKAAFAMAAQLRQQPKS